MILTPGGFASCDQCRFWQEIPDGELTGHCRRYAPRPVQFAQTQTADETRGAQDGVWPTTDSDAWCGEFAINLAKQE